MTSINKHSLISAISAITAIRSYGSSLCTALILCACCTLGSCTNDSDPLSGEGSQSRQLLTIRVSASSFTSLLHEGTPSTRTTEDGYETKFTGGEEIGVFAITNLGNPTAAYADNINNLKLVCSVDPTTQKVTWTPEDADKLLCYYDNLTYIAYYPYKAGITISISGSATSASILQQLADNTNLQPLSNQSTEANYTASDLMTAVATPAADPSSGTNNLIDLRFQHRHSLLVFKPMVGTLYVAPSGAGFSYHSQSFASASVDDKADVVQLNNITPCKMPDGSYRAIVLPNTTPANISGSYTSTDGAVSSSPSSILYSSATSTAFVAGSSYTLQVFNPLATTTIERSLAVGDFLFRDGSVMPKEISAINDPENCIGVVFYVGKHATDNASYKDKNGASMDVHGYAIVAAPNVYSCGWGSQDADGASGVGTSNNQSDFLGYSNTLQIKTKALSKNPTAATTSGLSLDMANNYPATYHVVVSFENDCPSPEKSSGWFLPSYGQLVTVRNNQSAISASLNKLGRNTLFGNRYLWSSTESGSTGQHAMGYNLDTGGSNTAGKGADWYASIAALAF